MDRCSACGGPYHPATGHAFTPTCAICHRCAGAFFAWVVRHTQSKAKRKGGVSTALSFYEHAATLIRPSRS